MLIFRKPVTDYRMHHSLSSFFCLEYISFCYSLNIFLQSQHYSQFTQNGKLEFTGNEIEKYFDVELIDDKKDEKDETFLIELVKTSSRGMKST